MKPQVSVILPVYNRSNSLADAMRSVLGQSYRDLELIVIDDASTENHRPIIESIRDPRVRFIQRERNGGAAAARNTGLEEARGEFIAFQDSDDLWLPRKLENQMRLLQALPPEVGAVTGTKVLYGRDARWNYGPGKVTCSPSTDRMLRIDDDQLMSILTNNRISLQNALFRLTCYPDRKWFDDLLRANVDWEFLVRLAQHSKIFMVNDPVVFSRISEDSVSRVTTHRVMAMVRIYNKNKNLYMINSRQSSIMLFKIGAMLYKSNKRKVARRLIVKGILTYPANITLISRYLFRYILKKIPMFLRSERKIDSINEWEVPNQQTFTW